MPVRPAAFARGVEIDDVQAGGPGRDEGHGLLERIAVDGLGGELSAEQAHALAGSDIDGGPQLQGHAPEGSSAQIRAVKPERIIYVSPAVEKIWGLPADRFYEDARIRVAAIHPDDRASVHE